MSRNGKLTRRSALGLIGAGAVITTTETLGVTQITAGRGIGVNASEDPDALLGIEGTGAEETPTFTNNTNAGLDVELDSNEPSAEFDVGADGTWDSPPVQFSLGASDAIDVDVRADVETITVDVTGEQPTGDLTVTLSRKFDVSQAGQVVVTPSVKSSGNSGQYEFGLENTGSLDATLVGLGINETSEGTSAAGGTADKVGGKKNDAVLYADDANASIVSTPIAIDDDPDSVDVVSFDQSVTLNPGEGEKVFEFDRFRDDNDKNAGMKDEDVRITLEFEDGSSTEVALCPNECTI